MFDLHNIILSVINMHPYTIFISVLCLLLIVAAYEKRNLKRRRVNSALSLSAQLNPPISFREVDYSSLTPINNQLAAASEKSNNRLLFIDFKSLFTRLLDFLKVTFLPSGYPHSVPPEYLEFQTWNLIQDLCSYLRGIMSTKAVLEGLGVGRSDITSVEATLLWILRDGASMIGGLLFTAFSSAYFGQNAKSWRLFADYINNLGITLDLLAPMSDKLFLPIICISSVFKSLCGIAAGATGSVISEHWGSLQGNIAEVNSKNGAQHTAVSLLGLFVSIPFARFACRSPVVMWSVYAVLTVIHVLSDYKAMRALRLRSINLSRGAILIQSFLLQHTTSPTSPSTSSDPARIPITEIQQTLSSSSAAAGVYKALSLQSVAQSEPILSLLLPHYIRYISRPRSDYKGKIGLKYHYTSTKHDKNTNNNSIIYLWASPSELYNHFIYTRKVKPVTWDRTFVDESALREHKYMIYVDKIDGTIKHIFVCFAHTCTARDQMRALFECILQLQYPGIEAKELNKALETLFPMLLQVYYKYILNVLYT